MRHKAVWSMLAALGILLLPLPALAGLFSNTTDATALLSANGRRLHIGGPVGCDKGERLDLRLTVSQRSTGAVAVGHFRGHCTGELDRWTVNARTLGRDL